MPPETYVAPSRERSQIMASVRHEHTAPELAVRRLLHAMGFRYRLHVRSLPGSPDIVLPKHCTVIQVNGCFWHGHRCRRGRTPATNRAFWSAKMAYNRRRDRITARQLRAKGWRVVTVWECRVMRWSSERLGDYLRRVLAPAGAGSRLSERRSVRL